jgi:hypothetical protein
MKPSSPAPRSATHLSGSALWLSLRAPLFLASLCLLGAASGCYESTPHRVQVASASPATCAPVITQVFAQAGFVQLSTPRGLSMFFAARSGGPFDSFLRTGAGVGVTFARESSVGTPGCDFALEALSPDVSCPGAERYGASMAPDAVLARRPSAANWVVPDPMNGTALCDFTSARSPDNDAAVDELARRVRVALGPGTRAL